MKRAIFFAIIAILASSLSAWAIPGRESEELLAAGSNTENIKESEKSAEELLAEARELFILKRPIDARAKLLKALQKAPNDHRPHMLLGTYYLSEVAHFKLAYRYLRRAEKLFEEKYGSDLDGTLKDSAWQEHARLLYLLSEARLNLDKYQEALDTLERFEKKYWDEWYPGTKAWVLMKLRRIDEAIATARMGLIRGAEEGRTYNILGILLSLTENRELSLDAFSRAIQAELSLSGNGQVATPLNNAGEVYRELFRDNMAEAAWLRATTLPDGCDHILPSLNLTTLYIDELRLLQASRVLDDFEACFSSHSFRQDTEHRALLALARGRLSLHISDADKAIRLLSFASEQEQWFGKIGTNENDVRFAVTISLAQALKAKAAVIRDTEYKSVADYIRSRIQRTWLLSRAWWLNRRAREIALDELSDFEDLFVRHTDTMLEYPTLGTALEGYPTYALRNRVQRMLKSDKRKRAHSYYLLYLGTNLLANGNEEEALGLLEKAKAGFRTIDRLARAEVLARIIRAKEKILPFWKSRDSKEFFEILALREELYSLLPSHLRYHDMALPVRVRLKASSEEGRGILEEIRDRLLSVRFEKVPAGYQEEVKYELVVLHEKKGGVHLSLNERVSGGRKADLRKAGEMTEDEQKELINKFINSAFTHRVDPAPEPVPALEIM